MNTENKQRQKVFVIDANTTEFIVGRVIGKRSYKPLKIFVNTFTIDECDEIEVLGLTIDKELNFKWKKKKLNFSKHIDKLCRNAQCKLHALRQIRKYLSLEKQKGIVAI